MTRRTTPYAAARYAPRVPGGGVTRTGGPGASPGRPRPPSRRGVTRTAPPYPS
ncbi:hypothetical protein SFR_6042 [Streptomyces sp. FR-008]|nr:hypothetical protein SFR_6042 [Streptomyces sp. FR-008]